VVCGGLDDDERLGMLLLLMLLRLLLLLLMLSLLLLPLLLLYGQRHRAAILRCRGEHRETSPDIARHRHAI
jgi:hypothetical protein